MRVKQMINNNGNAVKNQFVIEDGGRVYFQSYDSIIAKVDFNTHEIIIGNDYNYSTTTGKYRNIFFGIVII